MLLSLDAKAVSAPSRFDEGDGGTAGCGGGRFAHDGVVGSAVERSVTGLSHTTAPGPPPITYLVQTPSGKTAVTSISPLVPFDAFLRRLLETAAHRDYQHASSLASIHSHGGGHKRPHSNASAGGKHDESPSEETSDRRVRRRTHHPSKHAPPARNAYVMCNGRVLGREEYHTLTSASSSPNHHPQQTAFRKEVHVTIRLRLRGGMADRQNRAGSKFGGGGVSSTQNAERDRKERLRELALESVDLAKDPYLMRNHLGTYECKLCLTLHTNEGNYLAHTQGKKHQAGLARRAAMEAKLQPSQTLPAPMSTTGASAAARRAAPKVRIGRPGYEVSKSRDPDTHQRCLSFELHFPELNDGGVQPRHRFMSAYEQRVESPPDRRYQYLLVACEPYETVAFKIPNEEIDRGEGRFVTNWDVEEKRFTLTLYFVDPPPNEGSQ